ncbi:hypothetical protein [Kribbella sp. CA-293567]|uniref:hypothetical protein n=1 Tax=Kribbella sp. CA-293567 TaxID=3002436 RepID=UPI0022DCF38C|nr:hypothetical protein [Kribbella sp. CA-293567]WBQ07747.1 hypothetical protein OX958_13315 [Kribbella sp. CA-293567]
MGGLGKAGGTIFEKTKVVQWLDKNIVPHLPAKLRGQYKCPPTEKPTGQVATVQGTTNRVLPKSHPIGKSLGAASRAEQIARKLKMNASSPTTRQVLNSLDMPVEEFISKYRLASIWGRLGSEVRGMTVEEAITSSKMARKLLVDGRFARK